LRQRNLTGDRITPTERPVVWRDGDGGLGYETSFRDGVFRDWLGISTGRKRALSLNLFDFSFVASRSTRKPMEE
jgi:hypothetical protein